MTYDPYQTYATPYATPGGYAGIGNPFQTHSAAVWNPLTAYQPQPAYLQNPLIFAGLQQGSPHALLQQLAAQQLAQQIVAQQLAAQQNPYGQPFGPQQGMPHPQFGQIGFAGQGNSPFGQPGSPFNQIGVPLAPQSWVGQAGQLELRTNQSGAAGSQVDRRGRSRRKVLAAWRRLPGLSARVESMTTKPERAGVSASARPESEDTESMLYNTTALDAQHRASTGQRME